MPTSTPGDATDVTLGELFRGLQRLTETVEKLRVEMIREVESQVALRLKMQGERIGRLEKVVYGAVGVICTGVLIGLLSLVLSANKS